MGRITPLHRIAISNTSLLISYLLRGVHAHVFLFNNSQGITVTIKQNSRSIIFITEHSTVAFKFPKVVRPDTSAFKVESKIKLESYPRQNLKA